LNFQVIDSPSLPIEADFRLPKVGLVLIYILFTLLAIFLVMLRDISKGSDTQASLHNGPLDTRSVLR